MNTSQLTRALIPTLLVACACRATDETAPEPAPKHAADPAAAQKPAAPVAAPVSAPVAQPAAQPAAPVAQVEPVEDEFHKLLAGMGVRFFAAEKKLEVNGWVNMQKGLVEVFACAPQGKTHEAVVVLDCIPSGLHAGLLALDLEPGTPVEFGTADEYKPPTGDLVEIEIHWRDAQGVEQVAHAEDWVWDEKHKAPMQRAPWIFAGSFLQPVSGTSESVTFAADYVKSLATTYHDASSILENPEADGIDDTVYFSNDKAVPAVGTPITAVFRAAKPSAPAGAK
jgi:hypothetical protein